MMRPMQSPKRKPVAGERIYFDGDMANEARDGSVVRTYSTEWGSFMDIRWDCTGEVETGVPQNLLSSPRWGWIEDRQRERARRQAEWIARTGARVEL